MKSDIFENVSERGKNLSLFTFCMGLFAGDLILFIFSAVTCYFAFSVLNVVVLILSGFFLLFTRFALNTFKKKLVKVVLVDDCENQEKRASHGN